jgi:hypothetical protein
MTGSVREAAVRIAAEEPSDMWVMFVKRFMIVSVAAGSPSRVIRSPHLHSSRTPVLSRAALPAREPIAMGLRN